MPPETKQPEAKPAVVITAAVPAAEPKVTVNPDNGVTSVDATGVGSADLVDVRVPSYTNREGDVDHLVYVRDEKGDNVRAVSGSVIRLPRSAVKALGWTPLGERAEPQAIRTLGAPINQPGHGLGIPFGGEQATVEAPPVTPGAMVAAMQAEAGTQPPAVFTGNAVDQGSASNAQPAIKR